MGRGDAGPRPVPRPSRASHHQMPPRSGANVTGGWLVKPLMRRGIMGRPAAPPLRHQGAHQVSPPRLLAVGCWPMPAAGLGLDGGGWGRPGAGFQIGGEQRALDRPHQLLLGPICLARPSTAARSESPARGRATDGTSTAAPGADAWPAPATLPAPCAGGNQAAGAAATARPCSGRSPARGCHHGRSGRDCPARKGDPLTPAALHQGPAGDRSTAACARPCWLW